MVVMVVESIASEKVMAIVVLFEIEVAESAGEVEETVGAVVSTVKELTDRDELTLPAESVTVRVQSV